MRMAVYSHPMPYKFGPVLPVKVDKAALVAIGLVVLLTATRYWILSCGCLELSPDEAHYWEWSRRPALAYYSKPPALAWLIWIGTQAFGDTELGVRFWAPILSGVSSLLMYCLTKGIYGPKAGLIASVLLQIIPVFSAFGLGMTPDTLLIFWWLLSLYLFHRAWSTGTSRDWGLLVVALGMGLISKQAILLLYIPAFMLLFATPQGRRRLTTPWPYLSFALSLVFFLPVITWNSMHGWVMFRHDLGHTHLSDGLRISGWTVLNFIVGQLGIATPLLAIMILYLLIAGRARNPFCFWLSIPILIGFLIKSIQGKVQANWAMTAWLPGLVVMADYLANHLQSPRVATRLLIIGALIIPLAGTVLIHVPGIILNMPWPTGRYPLAGLTGWRQLGKEVDILASGIDRPYFIFSDRYQISSELAFYVPGRPVTYCINLGRRMNQYDLWPGFEGLAGHNALYVTSRQIPDELAAAFDQVEEHTIVIRNRSGQVVKRLLVYLCHNLHGWSPSRPKTY